MNNSHDAKVWNGYADAMLFGEIAEIRDATPRSAPLNMALDEVLLAQSRAPLLRTYLWAHDAVSFGYFGKFAPLPAAWPGREIVRRMTGGGVVPHGDDLTYSLIVPAGHEFAARAPREVYRAVHAALAVLLASGGGNAALAPAPSGLGNGVCFESPAEFDIIAGAEKIAGAAMRRTRDGLLLQGSIQSLPALEALRTRIAAAFSTNVITTDFAPQQIAEAELLATEKYATREWTMRV